MRQFGDLQNNENNTKKEN